MSHTLSNPRPSYPNSAGEQGEEIEFPPLKDRPPNPHQQELREPAVHQVSSATVVRPIRFLLFTHNAFGMREHTRKHAGMRARKKKKGRSYTHMSMHAQTDKYGHNQRNANIYTYTHTAIPLPSAPASASTINNLRHCGACDPATFHLWS